MPEQPVFGISDDNDSEKEEEQRIDAVLAHADLLDPTTPVQAVDKFGILSDSSDMDDDDDEVITAHAEVVPDGGDEGGTSTNTTEVLGKDVSEGNETNSYFITISPGKTSLELAEWHQLMVGLDLGCGSARRSTHEVDMDGRSSPIMDYFLVRENNTQSRDLHIHYMLGI